MKIRIETLILLLLIPISPAFAKGTQENHCPENQHWVRAHHRRAFVRGDGTRVSAANVTAHCQTNAPTYLTWKDRLKSKQSKKWLDRGEMPRNWSSEERDRILTALAELPPELLATTINSIYRLRKSSILESNPASGNADEIAIYDSAFDKNSNLTRILAHEFAHEVYRQMSDADTERYRIAAEWLLIRNPKASTGYQLVPNRDDNNYVEPDGMDGLTDDFSNNIEYFLFAPATLKAKTPRVYEWIRNRFGDKFKLAGGLNK